MRVSSLEDLAPVEARTLIINVHTDLVATRALLSAERAGLPVLLVNCEPSEASTRHFDELMARYGFDILDAPLLMHGNHLDSLFSQSRDARLLLLDSDAELRDPSLVEWMNTMLEMPNVFGAGFLEGPYWLPESWRAPPKSLLVVERPWIPCVMLRVEAVRRALAVGRGFREHFEPNEVWFSRRVSNFLAARFPPPWGLRSDKFSRLPDFVRRRAATWSLDGLRWARQQYYGLRPKMVCYDTGALIYEYLRYGEGLVFAGLDVELVQGRVHHYKGVTRSEMFGPLPCDVQAASIEDELREDLASRYSYHWDP
jgi:hypothetical protein